MADREKTQALIYKVSRYNNKDPVPPFISVIESQSLENYLTREKYFPGACYMCGVLGSEEKVELKRCTGCQLLSYCSEDCQNADLELHKKLCKKFPVINGKNVIVRKIESLGEDPDQNKEEQKRKYQRLGCELHMKSELDLNSLFMNPPVCNICYEARPEKVFDCHCCAVSYCSKKHQDEDEYHWMNECIWMHDICAMGNWYLTKHHQLKIPEGLLNEASITNGLNYEHISNLTKYSHEKWLKTIVHLVNDRLTIPLIIYKHALKKLYLGEEKRNMLQITSLNIHIVTSFPMLDPRMWEFFLHQLPNLKNLNLTFITKGLKLYNMYNSFLPIERCSECSRNQRVITYNIQPKHYHEYSSSEEYVKPDVVVVVNVVNNLLNHRLRIEKTDRLTTLRNMTDSKDTVVLLTGGYKDQMEECLKKFREAGPINVLTPIRHNGFLGSCLRRTAWPSFLIYDTYLLCCIQGINRMIYANNQTEN